MTYRGLTPRPIRSPALLIRRGVNVGDRVARSVPNVLEFPVIYYGILKAGAVVVPMNSMLKRAEVAYHLRDSGARASLFCRMTTCPMMRGAASTTRPHANSPLPSATSRELLGEHSGEDLLVPTDATDTAVILYTSGTTGKPKAPSSTR